MRLRLPDFMPCIAFAAAIPLMAAAGCDGNDDEGTTAEEATTAPTTESVAPAPPLDTPAPPTDETVPGELETTARELLADELDLDEGDFRLGSSEAVGWPDASLGCPKEGYAYAQVVTPGYKLVFDLAGEPYAVHTNSDGSHMVICGDAQ